jgi:hypothetical protein
MGRAAAIFGASEVRRGGDRVTWRQTKEVALAAMLLAVLLMLYAHVLYYLRHSAG